MNTSARQDDRDGGWLSGSPTATVQEAMVSVFRSPRFAVSWSGSAVKWVAITDRRTGIKATGRDNKSWEAAMANAMAEMERQLFER